MPACLPRRMSWELVEGYRFDCHIEFIEILAIKPSFETAYSFYLSTDK